MFEDYEYPEVYIPFTPPSDGIYQFDVCNSTLGTRVHLFELLNDGQLGSQLVKCNDVCNSNDAPTAVHVGCPGAESYNEAFDIPLTGGQDYVLLVEKEAAPRFGDTGVFDVVITCPATIRPSMEPTDVHSTEPSSSPSKEASLEPSSQPSLEASAAPSEMHSLTPSLTHSGAPSDASQTPTELVVSSPPTKVATCSDPVSDRGVFPMSCSGVTSQQISSAYAVLDCNDEAPYGFEP
eukprot:scaffold8018_cov678-Pinguiococcus_pyrenoidosus.AAC.1